MRIVTVEDARFIGIACEEADVVVTPIMLRFRDCRSGAMLLNGQSLRRTGAVEIFAVSADHSAGQQTEMRVVTACYNALGFATGPLIGERVNSTTPEYRTRRRREGAKCNQRPLDRRADVYS